MAVWDLISLVYPSLREANIVVANRVVLLDLWWNWQIENQAIDRYGSFTCKPNDIEHIEQAKRNRLQSYGSLSKVQ